MDRVAIRMQKNDLPESVSFLPFAIYLARILCLSRNLFFLNVYHSCHSKILPWMYDLYVRKLFFLNVNRSCHSEILPWCTIHMQRWTIHMQKEPRSSWMFIIPAIQRYYPECTIRIQKEPRSSWMFILPALPFRDTTVMYNPYADILPWCTIRIQKEHRSSLLLGLSGVANILRYLRYSTRRVSIVVWPRNNSYLIFPALKNSGWLVCKGKKTFFKAQPHVIGLAASVQRYGVQTE